MDKTFEIKIIEGKVETFFKKKNKKKKDRVILRMTSLLPASFICSKERVEHLLSECRAGQQLCYSIPTLGAGELRLYCGSPGGEPVSAERVADREWRSAARMMLFAVLQPRTASSEPCQGKESAERGLVSAGGAASLRQRKVLSCGYQGGAG